MDVNQTQQTLSNASSVLRREATQTKAGSGTDKMGKQDFMNLFLTQMSHQSPTDPMDSGAMMAQLAQLGTMEQLENLNKGMDKLNGTQTEILGTQAVHFLGKDVSMEVDGVDLLKGGAKPVTYNLPRDADNLRIIIEAEDGAPILRQNLGMVEAGRHQFLWDGKDGTGILQGDGKYKVRIAATYPDGNTENLLTFNNGRVTQVDYKEGKPWVKSQDRSMPLNGIKSVDNASSRLFGRMNSLPAYRDIPLKEMVKEAPAAKEIKTGQE